jgi:hypothetical protein
MIKKKQRSSDIGDWLQVGGVRNCIFQVSILNTPGVAWRDNALTLCTKAKKNLIFIT